VEIPSALQPPVNYAVAIVKGAPNADAAERFMRGLKAGKGRSALRRAGFGRAP